MTRALRVHAGRLAARTRLRSRIAMLLAGAVIGLAGAEAILRIVPLAAVEIHRRAPLRTESRIFFEYDPELGWRGRPGASGALVGWEFTSEVRLNTNGFRDREIAARKPSGTRRILLLGDSITWGYGVESVQRFGDRLGNALGRRGLAAEVANFAVSGYATDQQVLLWERHARPYCPDVVVLGLYENDLRENMLAVQGDYPKPYFRLVGDGTLALENVPVPRIPAAAPVARSGLDVGGWAQRHLRVWAALAALRETARGLGAPVAPPPRAPDGSVELTGALLRRLASDVERDGGAFVVVVLPDVSRSPATMQAALRSGVELVLDLDPAVRNAATDTTPLFYRLDGAHWTPRAHAVAAEAIVQWLLAGPTLRRSPHTCGHARLP